MTILDNSNFVVGVAFVAFLLVLWRFQALLKDLFAAEARAKARRAQSSGVVTQADAVRAVRDEAIRVAVGAAQEAIASGLSKAGRSQLIDEGIAATAAKLH